jgi:hypothetical protein
MQRDQTGEDEPPERAGADPPEGCNVAHVGDAGDEGGKHQRRDDHLDKPQEDGGDDA